MNRIILRVTTTLSVLLAGSEFGAEIRPTILLSGANARRLASPALACGFRLNENYVL